MSSAEIGLKSIIIIIIGISMEFRRASLYCLNDWLFDLLSRPKKEEISNKGKKDDLTTSMKQ